MSLWPSSKARVVLRALKKIGWVPDPEQKSGTSHLQLVNPAFSYKYTWAFHDGDELGGKILSRIAKKTGLKPKDL